MYVSIEISHEWVVTWGHFFILGGVLVLIWEQIGQKVQTIWKNSGVGYGQRREPFWKMFALKNMWV